MHLILRQIGTDEPDEIEVTGTLFAIGRYERPFSEYERSVVARLSKRHARIFEQDGRVFVADLGSTNGTLVNGRPVRAEPQPLDDGCKVSFGGLAYQVEIVGPPSGPAVESPMRLALTPEKNKDVLEPIVITRFPFLVNKHSDAFERYRDDLPDQLAFISRRHAHFFVRDGAIYIEDLGSTNGTFVSGSQLQEQAQRLEDGDTVGFGGDQFVYRVHLLEGAAEEGTTQAPSTIEGLDNPDRTIFIDSPTSFVDIYVGSQEPDPQEDAESIEAEGTVGTGAGASRPRPGRELLHEIRHGFFGGVKLHPLAKWTSAVIVLALLGGGGWYYWRGNALRQIDAMLERGEYADAAQAAEAYLAEHPDSTRARAAGSEALLQEVVPEWIALIRLEAFGDAEDLLERSEEASSNNPDDDAALALLAWRTRASRFLARRGGGEGLNEVLREQQGLGDLLEWWESDSRAHARQLLDLSELVADFKPVREQIYSDVRRLQALQREQQPARELNDALEQALARNDLAAVNQAIAEFQEAGGDPEGVTLLKQDAETEGQLLTLIGRNSLLEAHDLIASGSFHTSPFIEHAGAMVGREVPDEATASAYRAARDAWQEGRIEDATTMLDGLTGGLWGGEATALLKRYDSLQADYAALVESREQPGYEARLFEFYSRLDRKDDAFLFERLQPDLKRAEKGILAELERHLADAERAWSRYQDLGGIQPEQRLEDSVSDAFRKRAVALAEASGALDQAYQKHAWLDRRPVPSLASLHASVCQEVSRQRRALTNLGVISAEVQRDKLRLLPGMCETAVGAPDSSN